MKNKVYKNETQSYYDKANSQSENKDQQSKFVRKQNTHVFTVTVTHKYDFGEPTYDGKVKGQLSFIDMSASNKDQELDTILLDSLKCQFGMIITCLNGNVDDL